MDHVTCTFRYEHLGIIYSDELRYLVMMPHHNCSCISTKPYPIFKRNIVFCKRVYHLCIQSNSSPVWAIYYLNHIYFSFKIMAVADDYCQLLFDTNISCFVNINGKQMQFQFIDEIFIEKWSQTVPNNISRLLFAERYL